jgi:DNA-binding beta-propeller fold protein YncE
MNRILTNLLVALALVCGLNYTTHPDRATLKELIMPYAGPRYLSPTAIAADSGGRVLYLACATANEVAFYDVSERNITRRIDVPASPSGLVLSPDGKTLYVTCAAPKSWICAIETESGRIRTRIRAGYMAMAPALSQNGAILYFCNRFNNSVQALDTKTGKTLALGTVEREPVAAALTPDGKLLFVANLLPAGRADVGVVAASVSVLDTGSLKVVKKIPLTNGSTLLRGISVSPDGKYVAVTHGLARFHLPTTTVAHGSMNNSALSLIDATAQKLITTVLLDQDQRGAANPWAVQWTSDGKILCVTHAGTDEISLIDAGALLAKINALPVRQEHTAKPSEPAEAAQVLSDVPNDLGFLNGIRTRIALRGNGPRCMALVGRRIFVADYFSDSLSILDASCSCQRSASILLQSPLQLTTTRKGEIYFNDATLSYQGWQSCASCHSSDARVDGLDWDLINDGLGNPKNVKSLVFCFQTPPVMALGVRSDARAAIRAGMKSILFASPREDVASALDEFIKSIQPLPSPYLVHNQLSASAKHGQKLFSSKTLGCAQCHLPPFFTDLKPHPVGIGKFDHAGDQFYTPALLELWRTGPYMHDGSAGSLKDVVLTHGMNSARQKAKLTASDVEDLAAYLLSL